MIYFLISIIILTVIFVALYKAKVVQVCPICAGVVITWVGGVIALYTDQAWASPLVIAILMGASMGAMADKYGSKYGFIWKSLMVLLGFPAIYFIVQKSWWQGILLVVAILIATLLSNSKNNTSKNHNKDLFEGCC